MRYRVTGLTPLLVGDGRRLSPIDYMVWKDHVNVLDQTRIFRLLSKGPRLDGYLAQLKKADKLDFASWGGFAQNFAGRRIPFEHPSCAVQWERARGESLHIPTFFAGPDGPYLPGSVIKGALRTGVLFARMKEGGLDTVAAQFQGERAPKRPAETAEEKELGHPGTNRMRVVAASDSAPVATSSMKVYMLRVSALQGRGKDGFELGWKTSPRGVADGKRPEESTPLFAEMAAPGTVFEGRWDERTFFTQPAVLRALHWREAPTTGTIFAAANDYAAELLSLHKRYAEWAGLSLVVESVGKLEEKLQQAREGRACLLSLGWGAGLLSKVAWLKTDDAAYRSILRHTPQYGSGISPVLPFPKTRRIVFRENRPATLPGWVLLETE